MSTSRLQSCVTHCRDIAPRMDSNRVLKNQTVEGDRFGGKGIKERKVVSTLHRHGLGSLIPAQFHRGKSSCGHLPSDVGMSGKLGSGPAQHSKSFTCPFW